MKGVKKLSDAQKKPQFAYIQLTPKFTGKGWEEGVQEDANIMVYVDAKIAVFKPQTFGKENPSLYYVCDDIQDFADKFTIHEDDIVHVRRRMKIFLDRIKNKK
jgi:hypothetical protein